MGGSWRLFVRLKGQCVTPAEDHDEEIQKTTSCREKDDRCARGGLTDFLNNGGQIQGQSNRAVHHGCHYDPMFSDYDESAYQQGRDPEQKS